MSLSEAIPTFSVDLIHELDERFPLVKPKVTDDLSAIQRRAGQRDVVDFLLSRLAEMEENILEPK